MQTLVHDDTLVPYMTLVHDALVQRLVRLHVCLVNRDAQTHPGAPGPVSVPQFRVGDVDGAWGPYA